MAKHPEDSNVWPDAPEVTAAYEAVRDDKDDTNWLLISYAAAVGNKLTITATDKGGLTELAMHLDDASSTCVKFVLAVWIGDGIKVMRKARVSIESGDVKRAHWPITASPSLPATRPSWMNLTLLRGYARSAVPITMVAAAEDELE
ncbi:hypothetical protein B0J13DRAFT_628518 [Dactylonectria estremocensis]|uniref:ADF-H domain-containing protein n=1 Tax=Dactylonectria estremocensis TaxID=1079267 RepID=A0A9P9III6_9HYPO|nr:hypothetical protein B0J13DRAFT_628518 [Dactylonectria estremocensis]